MTLDTRKLAFDLVQDRWRPLDRAGIASLIRFEATQWLSLINSGSAAPKIKSLSDIAKMEVGVPYEFVSSGTTYNILKTGAGIRVYPV